MEILLKNTIWINLFVFVLIPFTVLFKSRVLETNEEFLSKDNTDILKGLSVVVVILSHIALFSVSECAIKKVFINSGFLAVSIFLFVSGYGLNIQYKNKDNYLKGYYKKIIYLYIVFIICNIVTTIINNLVFNTNFGVVDIIKSSLKFKFANGRELWFVAIILFLYMSFYIAFKFFKGRNKIIVIVLLPLVYVGICLLLKKGSWWYNTSYCFTLGVIFAEYKDRIFNFYKKQYWLKLFTLIIIWGVGMLLYIKGISKLQYLIPIVFILLVTMLLIKIKLKSKVFEWINKMSFEMYLIHLVILQVAFKEQTVRNSIYLVIIFIIIIAVSFLVHALCININKLLNKI